MVRRVVSNRVIQLRPLDYGKQEEYSILEIHMIWLFLIPIALLFIGLADMPIGYYTIVRITVCLISALSCYWSYRSDGKVGFATVIFGFLAILFNPIVPIYLQNKGAWTIIDILAAVLLALRYFTLKRKKEI